MIERNKIVYGQWTFTDDQIHEGSVYLAMSLISDSLEANTFEATVECADKTILDFERNTPLTYFNRGRQIGIFYVQSITRNGPTNYTISATSAIGMLIEGLHYGGIYTGQIVAEVLPSICGTVPFVVKTNLREIALYGWLPVASPRDNLSQVLFAIGAVLKTDLDGVLHIEGLWDGVSGSIGQDRMYMGPSVDYDAKVTQVVVTEHQYLEGGEETTLFEGTAQEGDIITFDEPMYNLQATGFTILESDVNYAVVTAGPGTLKGNAYVHNTRQISENVSDGSVPNVKTVTDATLISLTNSRSVAQRLANYYKSVQIIRADVSFHGESPGDLLNTWHPYDEETVSACLESADIQLSNTLKSTESLCVGFKPIPIGEASMIDEVEIISENTTWTVPDGVTRLRAVLIGGGAGGTGGTGGYGSDPVTSGVASNGSSVGPWDNDGIGGNGGESGEPGQGGKILILEIDVSPGQIFPIVIGHGGAGGEGGAGGPRVFGSGTAGIPGDAGTSGASGENTTFGDLSSENGSSSENGYLEIISGITYATRGEEGMRGGNGGGTHGGSQPGESLYGWSGGLPGSSDSGSDHTAQGGGGGGSAYGSDGHNGTSATYEGGMTIVGVGHFDHVYYVGAGGNGANASKAKNASTFGCGGQGGHGGGGAGNLGGGTADEDAAIVINWNNDTDTAKGHGGSGGEGGDGANGCVILYYSLSKAVEDGPIMTSDQKFLVDKYGRKIVV